MNLQEMAPTESAWVGGNDVYVFITAFLLAMSCIFAATCEGVELRDKVALCSQDYANRHESIPLPSNRIYELIESSGPISQLQEWLNPGAQVIPSEPIFPSL